MASKSKEKLSEADESYKEELDSLVAELLNLDLTSSQSETILLKLVDHATNDFGNISTIPKALQFLISHKVALDEYYKRYTMTNGEDNYALVLLLELVSFLEAINMSEPAPKGEKKEETEKEETPSFKLLLYKLEANLVAARLLTQINVGPQINGHGRETVEFKDDRYSYKISEKTKELLRKRKVNDWGNEYLTSLSSQIVAYFAMASTRQAYVNYLLGKKFHLNKYGTHKELHKNGNVEKEGKPKNTRQTVVLENNVNLVIEETLKLIEEMTTYWVANGFEFDAIDLLLEVDRIESIREKVSDDHDLVTRVTNYLASISFYGATYNESARILHVTYELLLRNKRYVEAVRIALKLNDHVRVMEVLNSCEDKNVLKQVSLFLNTSNLYINTLATSELAASAAAISKNDAELDETLVYLNRGENRSSLFMSMCKELDILEPKHPSEVFKGYPSKSNLSLNQTLSGVSIDSARDNLSYTFVSAFINCGSSMEKLINPQYRPSAATSTTNAAAELFKPKDGEWVFKHQGYGLMCASASLGLVHLWNLDEGLSAIDKYQYSSDQYVRSGSYAAFGLVSCGVMSEMDPIHGLLTDKLDSTNYLERLGAILGLGFAYGATNRMDLLELLIPLVIDLSSVECSLFSSLALSIMFVGTGNQESSEAILQVLMEYLTSYESYNPTPGVNYKHVRMYLLSLGLLQLCRGELCEPLLEALKVLGPLEKVAVTVVESFAYATSGDVLKIQSLLKNLISSKTAQEEAPAATDKDSMDMDLDVAPTTSSGSINGASGGGTTGSDSASASATSNANTSSGNTNSGNTSSGNANTSTSNNANTSSGNAAQSDVKDDDQERNLEELYGVSVLCIALLSLGENIGSGMLVRLLEHPLQCGTVQERRAVPLAVALVNMSNPAPQIVSLLSKLTHDSDREVSLNAILALGLVGAGTNNSRVSQLFQTIAKHSYRDATLMYVLRVSVGLLFMGKGTLTLSPLHSEGFLLNKVALAGLAVVLFSALDLRSLVCEDFPFLMLFLGMAIRPRWLVTLNTELQVVNVPVRVGASVDTIGTAGKQRRISGFQTHKSPVLIGVGERAELATEDMESLSPYLEGIVLVSNVSS
ncbi:26S proteasome regulatory subunit [Theileria orientalis strain Shintoku]|uniref:26S proteasome regulatory subunit n=1 Tax=Theileria orientalis strain Shintoku TaxID=869250 RepID=J4C7K0_THEOR|nr:26S proteasome regulatory subunit [Theileria orientalis strain Shintoku]BAM39173.1 26S proteasome regulatory subunit [Theileria orientalis strain Shintoku]|eukprot:XP_009689474.1 26S proteasome regulatory subunit [Theileria orientalis strain Shintoku]